LNLHFAGTGAGPISNQVRYEMTKQLNEMEEVSDEEDIS